MQSSWRVRATLILIVLATSVATASTGPITEAEATRLFLEQSPQARRVPLVVRTVDAALRTEGRVANPEIGYQSEEAAGVRDEFLTFQQVLPITGRRGLLDERAEVASVAAGLAAERELQVDLFELKRSFHEVLYRERVVEQLRDETEQLERAVEIFAGREREGEGSGYDVLRAEQELAEMRMRALAARAALAVARARFGSFYDPESRMDTVRLQGDLAPASPVPEPEQATAQALAQRLDLRALAAERESLDLERRAARRRRFPEPRLMAGWKRTGTLGLSDTGYVAALTVPLPIFDRGGYETERATSAGERVELEQEILARRIRADVQAAVAREVAARRVAEAFDEAFERRVVELQTIARLKYEEGESGILDLLDAHRTSLATRQRALAARYEAKSAEIDREEIVGNEVNP
jgi:cobalt-zinc-cadmium efflux system outer membrane protein